MIFAITFSLVGLTGPLAGLFQLPAVTIPAVHATTDTSAGYWYPAGAQEQTLSISQGDGTTTVPVSWLLTGQVDAEDWPLTAPQIGPSTVNCVGSTTILCSLPVPDHSYYEIQFNLANVLWGIPMDYGTSAAGVELRQGFAHLINKASFAANNAACLSIACIPDDQAIPPCNTAVGCVNGGLPAANPCNWDTKYAESSATNCEVGAPAGTSYNCSFSTTCPTGTVTGTTTFPWQAQIGSPDFCAAAQHFIQAFNDAGITGVTANANCELVAPSGGWPSKVLAINTSGCVAGTVSTANACAFLRTTEPRKGLGEGLTQDICALFSPAWGAWTTLAGQQFSCDNTNTGTSSAACGGGSCPFLEAWEGNIGQFCGFITSTTGVPNNCWGFGTFGFGQVYPFDSTTYFEYNSEFATETTVTCTNGPCTTSTPGSTCSSNVFSSAASDYMYVCSPTYDQLSTAMEFSTCLASPGLSTDPTLGTAVPTFANCSGGTVPGGNGATSCIGASPVCSAVSAGYQAEDYFGGHVFTLPVYDTIDTEARSSAWPLATATHPGWLTAIGGGYEPSANFWIWLNAYSSTPAVAGTLRQSFLTTVDSLNPFDFTTLWDGYVLANIYDGLFVQNPLCSNVPGPPVPDGNTCTSILQNIDWMTTSHSFLCYPSGPACTATRLGYGNATYFANTVADLRLTLNRSNHWQDAGPVTAWDVKYSFMNLNATGSFQASSLSNISHINVLDEFTVDLNLKAKSPFTEQFIGGVTVIPGHVWSACGASTWNSGVAGTNLVAGNIRNAAEDTCVGQFGAPSIVTVGTTRADSPTFDPMANNFLIGSGPYSCESIGGSGHPAVGTLGGGCSIDNTQAPAFGLGDFTLTRTGCTLTSIGTTCGAAGSSSDYFHSSGALAKYVWTGDIGSGSADFSKLLTVNSCHSSTPSANCPHWAQGIGNPGGTGTNPVGLSQRLAVNSYKGISWIGFSTEKTTGTQLILTCAAGYTIPGTTITPCTASNAGWTGTVLPGIGGYAATLYEVGSNILSTSTSTLAPASVIGCAAPIGAATAYPNGGYDC
jgi:hypothetical protein